MNSDNSAGVIAARFGFKRSGSTWRGPCPAHNGEGPSLAIWDGEGGSIGAKCHSEDCSYKDIIRALRAEYTYYGRVHHYGKGGADPVIRSRGPGKNFRLKDNAGSPKGLLVKLSHPDRQTQVLVEGEYAYDAVAYAYADKEPRTVSAAHWVGGLDSVADADYSPLKGRDVTLWPDAHADGILGMQKAATCLLGVAKSIKMVNVSGLPDKADAADVGRATMTALLDAATDYEESIPGEESMGLSGAQFPRTASGLKAALLALRLTVRSNARDGSAEVRRVDFGGLAAVVFEKAAGLDPTSTGWAHLSDRSAAYIRDWFTENLQDRNSRHYKLSQDSWGQAILAMTAGSLVDPVVDWLESLPAWDGVERIPTMWTDALGTEDTPLNRATACAFMVAAIRRCYEPGCQHDLVPFLIGGQGGGKSTFCIELTPPEFSWHRSLGTLADTAQKKAEVINTGWIIEASEFRAGPDNNSLKNYISDRIDSFRAAYAHAAETWRRRWVCIATANDEGEGVLPDDPTGARRYVSILVSTPGATREAQSTHVRQYLAEYRELLWGEALHRYHSGEKSYLGGEFEVMQDTINAKYMRSNPATETIAAQLTQDHMGGVPVTLADLLIEARLAENLADAEDKMRSAGKKLSGYLVKNSWYKERITPPGRVYGSYWFPPARVVTQDVEADAVRLCQVCGTRPTSTPAASICSEVACLQAYLPTLGDALDGAGFTCPHECPACQLERELQSAAETNRDQLSLFLSKVRHRPAVDGDAIYTVGLPGGYVSVPMRAVPIRGPARVPPEGEKPAPEAQQTP